ENGEIKVYKRNSNREKGKKDTDPNSKIQDDKIFRNMETKGKDFVDDVEIDESNYVEKKELIWRYLNNISTIGSTSNDEIVRCVPGVEEKLNHITTSEYSIKISLGISDFEKIRVSSDILVDKTLLFEEVLSALAEKKVFEVDIDGVKVVQKFYVKHEFCYDVVLGIPCIKGKLMKNNSIDEEKEKCSDEKDNNIVNVRVNKSDKGEQKKSIHCQNIGYESCNSEARDLGLDYKNKRSIRLKDAFLENLNMMQILNSILKAKHNVRGLVRLNGVSC
ncbi:13530_t:CDS:2, partial [Dentiscutata heterogama]